MKTHALLLIAAFFLIVSCDSSVDEKYKPKSDILLLTESVSSGIGTDLLVDRSGNLLFSNIQTIQLSDNIMSPSAFVKQWKNGVWNQIGEMLNSDQFFSGYPETHLRTNKNGELFVLMNEIDAANGYREKIYVKKWSGSTWEKIGGALNSSNNLFIGSNSFDIDIDGNPVASFTEGDVNNLYKVYVKKFENDAWKSLGDAVNINKKSGNGVYTELKVINGKICVVWTEEEVLDVRRQNIYVKTWIGNQWQPLGAGLRDVSNTDVGTPSLIASDLQNPLVAFKESASSPDGAKLSVKEWNGSRWENLGEDAGMKLAGVGFNYRSTRIDLALDDQKCILIAATLFEEGQSKAALIKSCDKKNWNMVKKFGDFTEMPSLAIANDGKVYYSFVEYAREFKIWQLNP
jgi:hypothetical protein